MTRLQEAMFLDYSASTAHPTPSDEASSTRQFSVAPSIIRSLIKAQAGTLAKGLLECVMNSVDAGATCVDIELTHTKLSVRDDGRGFQSRQEIQACFEVFGFEHQDGDRAYGQFGIGRAQLWNFCSTVWRTNGFVMDVDIEHRGLHYTLIDNAQPPVQGLHIEGSFYEPLRESELLSCERELKDLALYVSVPVRLNGRTLSCAPAEQKWTHETEHAWVRLSSAAPTLTVYNLGARVRDYPASAFGTGGVVVTKPGVRLALNMARNDIIVSHCKVWKQIRPYLQARSDDAVRRTKALTEEQMANLCARFLAGEVQYEEVSARKLITDVCGRRYTIAEFFDAAWASADQTVTAVTISQAGPTAEAAQRGKHCLVLDHKTPGRWGAHGVGQFLQRLHERLLESGQQGLVRRRSRPGQSTAQPGQLLKATEDWTKACWRVREGYEEVAHAQWTKVEQAAMAALRSAADRVRTMLIATRVIDRENHTREIRMGVSGVADAWTDGVHIVWIDRQQLQLLSQGMAGAVALVSLLVHEYLHEGASSGTHVHDEAFYERFHQAHVGGGASRNHNVGRIAQDLLYRYAQEIRKRGGAVHATIVRSCDVAQTFEIREPQL